MSREEKIFLVECLLYDMRLDFPSLDDPRLSKVISLCGDLKGDFSILKERCQQYIDSKCTDGRFFRADFPKGYYGMDDLHGLSERPFEERSKEFQNCIYELVSYPEYIFNSGV